MTTISSLVIAAALVAQAPKATEVYDKFRDTLSTSLDLGEIPIAAPHGGRIGIIFHRTTKGPDRRPSSPEDYVSLHFVARNESWRYLKYRPVILLIDGKRLNLGEPRHDGSASGGYVLEQFHCPFTVAQAADLGRAGEVLIRVGLDEISLDLPSRNAILAWTRRLQMERADQDREWAADKAAEVEAQARRKAAADAEAQARRKEAEARAAEEQVALRVAQDYRAGWRSIYQRSLKVARGGSSKFRVQGKARLVAELARKYGITERQVTELHPGGSQRRGSQ
jgi:hypothetical protein